MPKQERKLSKCYVLLPEVDSFRTVKPQKSVIFFFYFFFFRGKFVVSVEWVRKGQLPGEMRVSQQCGTQSRKVFGEEKGEGKPRDSQAPRFTCCQPAFVSL